MTAPAGKLSSHPGLAEGPVYPDCNATTHHGLEPAERAHCGITDSVVRLSASVEDADDLIADLAQALDTDWTHPVAPARSDRHPAPGRCHRRDLAGIGQIHPGRSRTAHRRSGKET
ncbi:PLP-dependent transferase [Streptomyces cinereoruber]|uniref:PLP-dependent transferase n=1 Tax=Streptomyces cinereoruber TaxID=67260 RepID=UPI003644F3EF